MLQEDVRLLTKQRLKHPALKENKRGLTMASTKSLGLGLGAAANSTTNAARGLNLGSRSWASFNQPCVFGLEIKSCQALDMFVTR